MDTLLKSHEVNKNPRQKDGQSDRPMHGIGMAIIALSMLTLQRTCAVSRLVSIGEHWAVTGSVSI